MDVSVAVSLHDRPQPDPLEAALAAVASAEARHLRLAERNRRFIETTSEAFVGIDSTGKIIDWNPQAERTFGWQREEVIGRRLAETLVPPPSGPPALAGLTPLPASAVGQVLGQRLEMSVVHRDGHVFPVELTLWASSEGDKQEGEPTFHAFIRDVTHRHEADEERWRLAAIVESSDEAIIGASPEGTILSWNRGAERLFGYDMAEVVGKPISSIVECGHREEVGRRTLTVRDGRPVHHFDVEGLRRNGVVLDVSMTMSPIVDGTGRVAGLSIVARDVTEQRWMAKTLNSTLASLEDALRKAKESEARCRRFTGDAAHQLRTPIAGIRACAETLLRNPPPEERDALLTNVVRETGRAARLMTGLLQMARLDLGQSLAPRKCDVVDLCSEEVARARALAPALEVALQVDERRPTYAELDSHAVHEILANLLDNARRHAASRIDVVVANTDDQVEVRVVDDGPGLSEALAERVFERFVSLDNKGGSGLGLPIARGLARTHGGNLTYEDRAFVVRLPVKAAIDCGGASKPDFGPPETVPDWESWEAP